MSDPGKYRTAQELEDRKAKDPLVLGRQKLEHDMEKGALDKLEAEVEAEV
jgi:pyruvate dehydrogenase E1 component alpha subunit